jgi:queuine tRNA-ribosyltransferase
MPVGTNASVKAMQYADLEELGVNLILGNTYHLYLRPGREVIEDAGGLHGFMGWNRNILTDSGGYQVFSLASFRTVDDDGVTFRSHIDGSTHRLTPADVVDIQLGFGSDVIMPLDECTAPGTSRDVAMGAVARTSAWLGRSAERWAGSNAAGKGVLFGIMQGNFYPDLREQSASQIVALDLPGYAIGGLSVGEEFSVFRDSLRHAAALLPPDKPRYLMGIGTPDYILEAVEAGIDLFDCVYPTRIARNAQVLTQDGPLSLRNEKYRSDFRPIEETCRCQACTRHTRAYLRHLFKAREIQAAVLATCHNLAFIEGLVEKIRAAVADATFIAFKADFLARYQRGEA